MTGDVVLYSETGMSDEDGEEIEVMYLVPQGESCEDAMSELRKLVELKWEVVVDCHECHDRHDKNDEGD